MTELDNRCLDTFPKWLEALPTDATELASLLDDETVALEARRHVASALNYLFKSLDLIPDGIEDLGFLDDAFVLRVAAGLAASKLEGAPPAVLSRLAEGGELIASLLGPEHGRLVRYVEQLLNGAARGRTTDEIVGDPDTRAAFVSELSGWARSYAAPGFSRDPKNLVKLTSFLAAKLPA